MVWISNILLVSLPWITIVLGAITIVTSISTGFDLDLTNNNNFIL